MKAYIKSISCISAQNSFPNSELDMLILNSTAIKHAIEPNYKDYVNAGNIRRLNRIIKMAFVTAIDAVSRANILKPDAIISGTGKGSLTDTEKFLMNIFQDHERLLNPVNFINATYNALNGLIGVQYQLSSYCNMFVHRGLACYSAISDAMLLLNEDQSQNILINVYDEITPDHYFIKSRLEYWKPDPCEDRELLKSTSHGTTAGEGATSMILSSNKDEATNQVCLELLGAKNKSSISAISKDLLTFIHTLKPDLILCGYNGDIRFKDYVSTLKKEHNIPVLSWKPLSGEFETADGFGIWFGHSILKKGFLDDKYGFLQVNQTRSQAEFKKKIERILIYNHFFGKDHVVYFMTLETIY
jgi:hypothetical protein